MSTAVEIWNQACMKIGADRITSFGLDSEAQMEAALADTIYNTEKLSLLRSYPWNCSIKRAALALSATPPLSQFSYAYALPTDCLRVLEARTGDRQLANINGDGVRAYVVEGRFVLTNETGIILKYVSNIDESEFDAHLEQALVAKICAESVYAIGQSVSAHNIFLQIAEAKLQEARITDGLENPHVVTHTEQLNIVRW